MPDQDDCQGLVLSVDTKPRLRWTRQLNDRFVDAVSMLGGADKATPKSVMQVMGIPGLTLYHLKSHLQKYRLAQNNNAGGFCNNIKEDSRTKENESAHMIMGGAQNDINESMLQMQMKMQRKLNEQIEVQRHLQLRIEAQGKYLQSVLSKAKETLAGYNLNHLGVEAVKAELSELVSAVDTDCRSPSSSISGGGFCRAPGTDCSTDSCLTSSEQQQRKDESKLHKSKPATLNNCSDEDSDEIILSIRQRIETPKAGKRHHSGYIGGEACIEQLTTGKRLFRQKERVDSDHVSEELDLNR